MSQSQRTGRIRRFVSRAAAVVLAAVFLLGVILSSQLTAPASAAKPAVQAPVIHAKSAIVMDLDTGRILYAHDVDTRRRMASTTKIMTAILVLNNMSLDHKVTVSKRAAAVSPQAVGLEAGDRLTVRQLLYGALVYSGNDAALALAEACSGSESAFVAKMNRMAAKLGLHDTHFVNPHGLDAPGQYSSARDLAKLARYAMQNSLFRKIVGTVSYSLTLPGRSEPFVFRNVNKLLGTVGWVTGIKTGSTAEAGYCLVASGSRNGKRVVSVVLGEPTPTLNWSDSKALLEYGFARE